MVKRKGLAVRGGNWVFHDNGLLVAESLPAEKHNNTLLSPISPDTLGEILSSGVPVLTEAAHTLWEVNRERSTTGEAQHPWLFTVKLAHYSDTFQTGLVQAAEALSPETSANNNYPRGLIREQHHTYLDIFNELPFIPRVPGRMSGYNTARDGLWLQIKHHDHYKVDEQ